MEETSGAVRVLIIEDDGELIWLLTDLLKGEGYQVLSAHDGVSGLQIAQQRWPHLILLDLMLPRLDGYETCRRIREFSDVPIIILSGRADERAKVRGLDLGANDYITKPFGVMELLARMRASLRHHGTAPRAIVHIDDRLCVDRERCLVSVDGQTVVLSPIEFKLLSCLLDNPNRTLSHQALLTQVWGWEYADERQYLKVHIHHLRHKIERDPSHPEYIVTERGLGYRLQVSAQY